MLLSAIWGESERVDYMPALMYNCTTQKAMVVESSPRSSAQILERLGRLSRDSSFFSRAACSFLSNLTFMYTIAYSASI